jgi:ankyrin repeat protein
MKFASTVFRLFATLSIAAITASTAYAGSYDDFFSAIRRDDSPALQALLQRGFDPNTKDPQGQPGLLIAAMTPAWKAAQVLALAPKIEAEARNKSDESPLMLAALHNQLDLAKALIDKDADVNKTGWAPLHYAASKGHIEMMNLLLENDAYIDAESPNKTTPLMMAAMYGTVGAVKTLLEAGADPTLKNEQGLTAIDFAQRVSRAEAASIIAAFIRARQPQGKW